MTRRERLFSGYDPEQVTKDRPEVGICAFPLAPNGFTLGLAGM
jgi:hypothetical protein